MIFDPALSAIAAMPDWYVPLTRQQTVGAFVLGRGSLNPPLGSVIAMSVTVAATTRFFLEWRNHPTRGRAIR